MMETRDNQWKKMEWQDKMAGSCAFTFGLSMNNKSTHPINNRENASPAKA
jgi:hypothetical protein